MVVLATLRFCCLSDWFILAQSWHKHFFGSHIESLGDFRSFMCLICSQSVYLFVVRFNKHYRFKKLKIKKFWYLFHCLGFTGLN